MRRGRTRRSLPPSRRRKLQPSDSLVESFSGTAMGKLADNYFATWTNGSSRVCRRALHEVAFFQLERHVNFS